MNLFWKDYYSRSWRGAIGDLLKMLLLIAIVLHAPASAEAKTTAFIKNGAGKTNKQTVSVSGIVTDTAGNPLSGVSVSVKSTKIGTITNNLGKFTISIPEGTPQILVFNYVGKQTQEVDITGHQDISIVLKDAVRDQDDVVVVAYGKQAKEKVTSAITILKTDQFKDAPYTDLTSAIAGRAAGVVVNFSGGEPGSVPSISIRGGEGLIGQTKPLYVIDDIIRDADAFNNLSFNDIESINFLKDAASTAVYGSKAAAGIILVTTKKGSIGKPQITYSNNIAWNTPASFPKLIDAYNKALVANAIGEDVGYGKYSAYTQGQLDTIKNNWNPALYPNTNWYDLVFKKYSLQQTHELSISGGNKQTQYYTAFRYLNDGSIYRNNAFRVSRFSYDSKVTSKFEKIGLDVTFHVMGYYNTSTQPPFGSDAIFSHVIAANPLHAAYNKDGTFSSGSDQPLSESYSPGYARAQEIFNDGNLTFNWAVPFVKGLSFRLMGDYALTSAPTKTFTAYAPQYNSDGTVFATPNPSLSQGATNIKTYDVEFQADYSHSFNKHTISATFVSVVRGGDTARFSAYRNNFPSADVDQMFAGDPSSQTNDGSASEWGEVGYVGRIHYDYAAKYSLEMSGRYDGSDYFPPTKRFGFFPSISANWMISSETFYKNLNIDKVFSYFKFRASYGVVGMVNAINVKKYAYIPQYNVNNQIFVANGNLENGYYEGPLTTANQNITWYSTRSRDFGIDYETPGRKITGSIDYYFTETRHILGNPAYSYTDPLGKPLPLVLTNAYTRKEGIDFSLNFNWKIGADLKGYIGVNGNYFNYLWVRSNEDSAALTNPFTRVWGVNQNYYTAGTVTAMYNSLGLYQNYQEILNNPTRVTSTALSLGDVWLSDANGDGKIDAQDYRRVGKPTSPLFTFGVPFGVEYKGFRLDALVQGTGNRDVYIGGYFQGGEGVNRINFDVQKDFWTPDNTNASFPRAGNNTMNGGNNYTTSTFWLKNAHFVRLKSLTLSYDIKRIWKTNVFSDLSLHIAGTNLLTFSPVTKYFDPEVADANNFFYPVNKTFSIGIRAGF